MVARSARHLLRRGPLALLVAAITLGAAALAACNPPKPPPEPPSTNACFAASATILETRSIADAEADAVEAVAEADADPELLDDEGMVPLVVTTEAADGSPEVHLVPVDDADEARAVGRYTAATGDVLAIEIDQPVYALETFPPNDQRFPEQWGLQSDKTTFGAAWGTATGEGVTVAVLDTGVQGDHPDLAANIVFPGATAFAGSDPYVDGHGHGTHVAGIAGAVTNNGIGVAGAAPNVMIRSVQVLDSQGAGTISGVAAGINWVVDEGMADVINMSLGSSSPHSALYAAVKHAWDNKVPMVAAAGNDGDKTTSGFEPGVHCVWPAGYAETITVASLDSNLERSSFSNRGDFLDLAAPGRTILSTYKTGPWGEYAALSGTSMATPFVAGAAAMLLEQCPAESSFWYRAEMRASGTNHPSHNIDVGYGLVDPLKALQQTAGC